MASVSYCKFTLDDVNCVNIIDSRVKGKFILECITSREVVRKEFNKPKALIVDICGNIQQMNVSHAYIIGNIYRAEVMNSFYVEGGLKRFTNPRSSASIDRSIDIEKQIKQNPFTGSGVRPTYLKIKGDILTYKCSITNVGHDNRIRGNVLHAMSENCLWAKGVIEQANVGNMIYYNLKA